MLCWCLLNFSFARDYYVSPKGNDDHDGTANKPWKTLAHALSVVPEDQNHTIHLSSGTFTESRQCRIKSGINVIGAGINKTTIQGRGELYGAGNPFEVVNQNLIRIDGNNIKVGKFTIEGESKKLGGGVFCRYSENVEIYEINIRQAHANAVWVRDSRNVYVHDIEAYDCSWSSSGWASGAIHYGGSENVVFERVKVEEIEQRSGSVGGGNAFKALGEGPLVRVKFIECEAKVNWYGTWQNGKAKNISLEIESSPAFECEVINSSFNASVSLVGDNTQSSGDYDYTIRFAGNVINNEAGSNTLELGFGDAIVEENYFNCKNGGYGIKNWGEASVTMRNWEIRNNIFWLRSSGWPTTIVGSRGGIQGMNFTNNTIHLTGPPTAIITVYGNPNNSGDINISNNIFFRNDRSNVETDPEEDWLIFARQNEGYHSVSDARIKDNIFFNFPETSTPETNVVENVGNEFKDPGLRLSGSKPFPYYEPRNISLANVKKAGAKYTFKGSQVEPGTNPPRENQSRYEAGNFGYPNPANRQLYFTEEFDQGTVTILDLNGSVKINAAVKTNRPLNIESLLPGMYLLKFSTEGQSFYQRIIKE